MKNYPSVVKNHPSVVKNHLSVVKNHPSVVKSHPSVVKNHLSVVKNHPSVAKTKETYKHFGNFDLPKASPKDINKIIKSLNSKKAAGPNKIPFKLVKLAANIIDCHICNILNQSISSSMFPEQAKIANVKPIYK